MIIIFFALNYPIGTSEQNRRLNVTRDPNNNLNSQYQTVIDSVNKIIRALSERNSGELRALLNNINGRQPWMDYEGSTLAQSFPHWMESLDGIFTTDFFFNGHREVVARAIFSFDNNHNVIFLGIGNTKFTKKSCFFEHFFQKE